MNLNRPLEEFDHLGIRFVSVQDQSDTDSPVGWVMITRIGAMAGRQSRQDPLLLP